MVPFPFARFDGAARRDQVRLRFVHCGHQGIDVFELNAAERNGRPRRYLSRYVYACPCSGLRPAAPAPGCSPCHGWPAPVVACVAGARWVRRAGAGRRAGDKCARVVTRRVLQSRCAHARLRRGGVARAYAVRYIYAVITSLLVGPFPREEARTSRAIFTRPSCIRSHRDHIHTSHPVNFALSAIVVSYHTAWHMGCSSASR